MNNILTPEEIKNYKDIGNKIDTKKINVIIEQAQITDLKNALGDRFYFDVLNNIDNPIYTDLLNGSTFNYFGIDYHHDGLKALLADYFMAKYTLQLNTNFTPFGATTKTPQDGELADRNSLKDISTQQLQLAGSRLEVIIYYLDAHTTSFPQWRNSAYGENESVLPNALFKFRKI